MKKLKQSAATAARRCVHGLVGTLQCPCCSRYVLEKDMVAVSSHAEDGHVTRYVVCRECSVKDLF